MWWLRRVFLIAQCGSPRVEVQAAKLAGLALGAFDDPAPSAGAKIIIERAESTPDGTRTVERATIEGSGVTISSDGSMAFPITTPAKAQRRRKILNNLG